MEPTIERVTKGGECWLELTIDRKSKGMELWVRSDPRVEEFISTLSEGDNTPDPIETYGKRWIATNPEQPLMVRRMLREVDTNIYTLSLVGETLAGTRGISNISFLRIVGVGSGEGIRFSVPGPVNRDYIRTIKDNILLASRQLFRDYIVPVHISLRVTSTEL